MIIIPILASLAQCTLATSSKWIWNGDMDDKYGYFGDWYEKYCPVDKPIAQGMKVRFEARDPPGGDDSAGNAVQICCQKHVGVTDTSQCSWVGDVGLFGDWQSPVFCPTNTTISGFRQRIQAYAGAKDGEDDTGFNGVEMRCNDGSEHMVYEGIWGDWQDWVQCPDDWYVTGVSTRIEASAGGASLGKGGDDTGMNQMKLQCQNPTIDRIVGYWVSKGGYNDGGSFAKKTSINLQYSTEATTSQTNSIEISEAVSYGFKGFGGDFSSTQSETNTVSNSVGGALSVGYEETITVNCDLDIQERMTIWQFAMKTGYETSGEGGFFGPRMYSNEFSCNGNSNPPLCSPYTCSDKWCRECDKPMEPPTDEHLAALNDPENHWKSECCSQATWTDACYFEYDVINHFGPCEDDSCTDQCGFMGEDLHSQDCFKCCSDASIAEGDKWHCKVAPTRSLGMTKAKAEFICSTAKDEKSCKRRLPKLYGKCKFWKNGGVCRLGKYKANAPACSDLTRRQCKNAVRDGACTYADEKAKTCK